jgi:hypothetical protein
VLTALALLVLACAALPAALFSANLKLYRDPDPSDTTAASLSVLIPARNEEASIEAAVHSVLRSTGVVLEVIVMDDHSTDRTAQIVAAMAQLDDRVRLEMAPALPSGWNGKQHACWQLAHAARYPVFCFVDADVRVAPLAMVRMAAFLETHDAALVSGFPRQITSTWLEWLLIPLIHFVLRGFLPLALMRQGTDPAFAAGCGQFLMVRREAYFAAGGHAAIRHTMHDGLLLPRLLRKAGFRTDLADITSLAVCRMYTSASQVWNGLAKNATEGLAAPARIVPMSLVFLLGQVAPVLLIYPLWMRRVPSPLALAFVLLAALCAWLPRVLAARRFRQDWRGVALHPLAISILVVLQWYALLAKLLGREPTWKQRPYKAG